MVWSNNRFPTCVLNVQLFGLPLMLMFYSQVSSRLGFPHFLSEDLCYTNHHHTTEHISFYSSVCLSGWVFWVHVHAFIYSSMPGSTDPVSISVLGTDRLCPFLFESMFYL